jgi:hypothetical protein
MGLVVLHLEKAVCGFGAVSVYRQRNFAAKVSRKGRSRAQEQIRTRDVVLFNYDVHRSKVPSFATE